MLTTVTRPGTDLVEIDFSGTPEADSMRAAHDELARVAEEHGSLRLLARYGDIDLRHMSPSAFWEDLKNVALLPRISRCAVVADQSWVRVLTDTVGRILPCEVKAFEREQEPEARRWVGE